MLQLRDSKYAALGIAEELDQDESYLKSDSYDPDVLDTPIGWIRVENGSFVRDLALKIFQKEGLNGQFVRSCYPPKAIQESSDKDFHLNQFDFSFTHQDSSNGEVSCLLDINRLLLKNPEKFPEDIIAWDIPEFDDVIPNDERIIVIKKL
jgi:hypothetical protein